MNNYAVSGWLFILILRLTHGSAAVTSYPQDNTYTLDDRLLSRRGACLGKLCTPSFIDHGRWSSQSKGVFKGPSSLSSSVELSDVLGTTPMEKESIQAVQQPKKQNRSPSGTSRTSLSQTSSSTSTPDKVPQSDHLPSLVGDLTLTQMKKSIDGLRSKRQASLNHAARYRQQANDHHRIAGSHTQSPAGMESSHLRHHKARLSQYYSSRAHDESKDLRKTQGAAQTMLRAGYRNLGPRHEASRG